MFFNNFIRFFLSLCFFFVPLLSIAKSKKSSESHIRCVSPFQDSATLLIRDKKDVIFQWQIQATGVARMITAELIIDELYPVSYFDFQDNRFIIENTIFGTIGSLAYAKLSLENSAVNFTCQSF